MGNIHTHNQLSMVISRSGLQLGLLTTYQTYPIAPNPPTLTLASCPNFSGSFPAPRTAPAPPRQKPRKKPHLRRETPRRIRNEMFSRRWMAASTRPMADCCSWLWEGRARLLAPVRSPAVFRFAGVPGFWVSWKKAHGCGAQNLQILPPPPPPPSPSGSCGLFFSKPNGWKLWIWVGPEIQWEGCSFQGCAGFRRVLEGSGAVSRFGVP